MSEHSWKSPSVLWRLLTWDQQQLQSHKMEKQMEKNKTKEKEIED